MRSQDQYDVQASWKHSGKRLTLLPLIAASWFRLVEASLLRIGRL